MHGGGDGGEAWAARKEAPVRESGYLLVQARRREKLVALEKGGGKPKGKGANAGRGGRSAEVLAQIRW